MSPIPTAGRQQPILSDPPLSSRTGQEKRVRREGSVLLVNETGGRIPDISGAPLFGVLLLLVDQVMIDDADHGRHRGQTDDDPDGLEHLFNHIVVKE